MTSIDKKRPNLLAFTFTIIIVTSITLAITVTDIFVALIYALTIKKIVSFFVMLSLVTFSFNFWDKLTEKTKKNKSRKTKILITFRLILLFSIFAIYAIFEQSVFLFIGLSSSLIVLFYFYSWERDLIKFILKYNEKENKNFLRKQMIVYIFIVNTIIGFFLFFSDIENHYINLINLDSNNINIPFILSFMTLLIFEFFHKKNTISFIQTPSKS